MAANYQLNGVVPVICLMFGVGLAFNTCMVPRYTGLPTVI
jgi:hypothetical protein